MTSGIKDNKKLLKIKKGVPTTARLKERLYISANSEKQMSGLLIYTAEGSEGSMGGLVSQGEPEKIFEKKKSPGQMKKTLLGALMKVLNVAYFDTNLKSKSIRIVYTQSLFQ